MADTGDTGKRSWWRTLPGLLTQATALVAALSGLVVAIDQFWKIVGEPSESTSVAETVEQGRVGHEANADVGGNAGPGNFGVTSKAEHKPAPTQTSIPLSSMSDHKLLRTSAYRTPLVPGAKLHFYDLDSGLQFDGQTGEADFSFKPLDPGDSKTAIGVHAMNSAKYAARSPGLLPWELGADKFTTSSGVYSVPQGKNIPCYTGQGNPCTFQIKVEPQGELFVSFSLYK